VLNLIASLQPDYRATAIPFDDFDANAVGTLNWKATSPEKRQQFVKS